MGNRFGNFQDVTKLRAAVKLLTTLDNIGNSTDLMDGMGGSANYSGGSSDGGAGSFDSSK
jgi:hypothetical protein